MDFDLTEQQAAFRDLIRDFTRRSVKPVAREWELSGRYPTEIVDEMKAMGLFGMLVPEEYGGIGIDAISYAIVFEEISKAWMGVAGVLGSHSLATWMLARYGTEAQKRKYLPDLASGKRRTGIALTEPGAGSDLQGITTTARRDGDHYVVNGTKTWITNARHADPLPVLVKTDPDAEPRHAGMTILLIEKSTPGFTVGKDLGKLGYKGPESSEVFLNDCRVPLENALGGSEGHGLQHALSALEVGRVNIAGRAVGVAQACLDQALDYARERHAFGRPIAEFQAIQLKLADMATEVQAARLLTWWAGAALDAGERADLETGMAKLYASEVCLKASLEAMRIHGGYGYSTELDIERFYRDAPLMAIGEGTNDILRTVIARQLVRRRNE
ncbi:MAG TPA: acyl-CoA dehydrogenase family protein [Candidatus Dormibacteraeota bacterium]|nr:acyl-CoA dehydrogenase family protein [Candidatus Dormibacteraeota bacterium]